MKVRPLFLADVVHGADVGMVERRGSARLAAESAPGLKDRNERLRARISAPTKRSQSRVLSFVDHSHAAGAKSFADAVVRSASGG